MSAYNDQQIKFIFKLREETDLTWDDITLEFNDNFGSNNTKNSIRKTYKRYVEMNSPGLSDDTLVKNIQATYSARKKNSKLTKENNVLIESQITHEEFLLKFAEIIKLNNIKKVKILKKPKKKKKTKMIIEPMLSDIHFGLKTKTYDADVAKRRIKKYTKTILGEIARKEKLYSIDKIHIPLLGDFLQSATMHKNSGQACHLTNAEQLAVAVESIFYDFLLPLAKTGYDIDVSGICGNHDREATEQHTVDPGKTYFTYTIYKMLEIISKQSGLTRVTFEIPEGIYLVKELLGKYFIYEHGHTLKNSTVDTMEKHLIKRQAQISKIVSGIRIGHYHNDKVSSMGRHVVNASTVSDDHYGDLLGYKSRPAQVLNFYVDCKRDTSFFHSISVNLCDE